MPRSRLRSLAVMVVLMGMAAPARADEPKPPAGPAKVEPKPADGDAPLAKDFPAATKPGEIEVKTYPAYRGAVAKVEKATMGSGDMLFWPLFNHIEKNHVEMTAPVISTFPTPAVIETPGAKGEVSMEFVYREPSIGKAGKDGAMVEVVDHPEQKFVCLGVQGGMNDREMRDGLATLRKWLEAHKAEWVADGAPRRIGYHGPMTPVARRLWEVQVPVKAAAKSEK